MAAKPDGPALRGALRDVAPYERSQHLFRLALWVALSGTLSIPERSLPVDAGLPASLNI